MKKLLSIMITALTMAVYGQTFQGKIIYQNKYDSKIPNVSGEQLTAMMGGTQEYIIKNGDYKSTTNGSMMQWQLYRNKDNKLYSKMANSETIFYNDGNTNADEVLNVEVKKSAEKILGYSCDEVILTCKSGIQRYFYNSKLNVNPNLFTGHLFGNWYEYIKVANALPLKMIVENPQFTLTSTATEVKEMKLDDKEFSLPENAPITKSPY